MDREYQSSLEGFVDKTIKRWADDKRKVLATKLKKNFEAVTNSDFRNKVWKKEEGKDWRSTTWIGFVRVKVWSFYATMLDTVMRAGKIPFVLEPSPYDEKYMSAEMLKERDRRIDLMTAKIEQQLTQRNADREYMKKWLSGGYYGMAFSEFNLEDVEETEFKLIMPPQLQQAMQMGQIDPQEAMQYARHKLITKSESVPGHRYESIWNMVWDLDTENLQEGEGYAVHQKSCPYDLRKLTGPGYIQSAIEEVIGENRNNNAATDSEVDEFPGKSQLSERKKTIERYRYWMRAPEKYVSEYEKEILSGKYVSFSHFEDDEAESSGHDVEIMGEIADKKIIRHVRNNTGKRPHKMWVVEQNLDESTGTGIADNMESVQESLVGMIRAFEDNKKLSANVILALKQRFFNNPSQVNELKPGTKLDISDECDDARKAVMPIIIPDVGETLMSGISLMMQLKDDVSMIPTILQGFNLPKHQPDTAYEVQQLTANAGRYIGQAIRNNDEQFIEPEIKDIYMYNMLYGEDESCKVNCKVKANGFTSFQNKEIRGARMQQVLSLVMASEILSPYIEVEPHLEILYEAMDEDPGRFIKTEEKRAKEGQQQMQAQAQATQQAIQMAQAQAAIEAKKEVTVKGAEHQFTMQENDQEHEHRLIEDGVKAKVSEKKEPQQKRDGQ